MNVNDPLSDPLSPSLNETSTPPVPCCVRLRCKSMYYREDERPGKLHVSDTQWYWCNLTQDPDGPDNRDAHPRTCQPGRGCYCGDE
jgi:hypothetical protein